MSLPFKESCMKPFRSAALLTIVCLSATPRGLGNTQGVIDRAPVFGAPTNESPLFPVDPLNVDLINVLSLLGFIKTKSILIASKVCDMQTRISDIETQVDTIESKACDIQTRVVDIDTKVDDVHMRVPIIESKTCDIQTRVEDIDTKVDDVHARVPVIESKVCDIQTRVGDINTKICDIDTKVDHLFDLSCQNLIRQSDFSGGPLTISSPGLYCLVEDVMVSGSAIIIDSDNVRLNLNKNLMKGTGGGSAVVINGVDCTEVFNGSITGMFDIAIEVVSSSTDVFIHDMHICDLSSSGIVTGAATFSTGLTIEDCRIVDVSEFGMQLTGEDIAIRRCDIRNTGNCGIELTDSNKLTIVDCTVVSPVQVAGTGAGIRTTTSMGGDTVRMVMQRCSVIDSRRTAFDLETENSAITDCVAINPMTAGFNIVNGSNSVMTNCTVSASGGTGICVRQGRLIIVGCRVSDTEDEGILIRNTIGVEIKDCQIQECSTGINISSPMSSSGQTTIRNCEIRSNGTDGVFISGSEGANLIENCVIEQNAAGSGVCFAVGSACTVVADCIIRNNGIDGISVTSGGGRACIRGCNISNNLMNGIAVATTAGFVEIDNCNSDFNLLNGILLPMVIDECDELVMPSPRCFVTDCRMYRNGMQAINAGGDLSNEAFSFLPGDVHPVYKCVAADNSGGSPMPNYDESVIFRVDPGQIILEGVTGFNFPF